MASLLPLPIDDHVPGIVAAARRHRAVVVTASPGAGKTTRVPPALVEDGPVLLLQPRRVAARAIARRIAAERGWTLGREVGWHVRFDRHFTRETRLIVATEGILTARLQQDPLVSDFATIVIDEFHERSLHADLGLAMAREAWSARPDLRLVVMSATIDAARLSAYLDRCPVVDVPGRLFPVSVRHEPAAAIERVTADAVRENSGAVLCFLPGAPEIRRTAERLAPLIPQGVPVLPLHGGLDADEQDAALTPTGDSRVILATNLAETTLTVPDVTCVIDTGLHKVARYDADRAIDSLETERVSQDSADQRAGRAGRVRAGTAIRLWDARDRLRPHREAEIVRVDLAGVVLDILSWGGDPRSLAWYEAPSSGALDAAFLLLTRLGALDDRGRLTSLGRVLRRLPLHPRLGRMLIAGGADASLALACALLAERHVVPPRHGATDCDLLSAVDREPALPPHVRRVAREIRDAARHAISDAAGDLASPTRRLSDVEFRRAVLAGYPDRVAKRRAASGDRFVLASGTGARLARESGVVNPEFIVAVDVTTAGQPGAEALIRLATGIDPAWIAPTSTVVRHELDAAAGVVRAVQVELYENLPMASRPVPPDPLEAAAILATEYLRRGPQDRDFQILRRLKFVGVDAAFDDLVHRAAAGRTKLDELNLERALAHDAKHAIAAGAPLTVTVPSGRAVRLEYREDGTVFAAVKLQELFGLAETPRIGPSRTPVTFELLSPAGRPVQVTRDLRSFWSRGYPEVRKELRARYPRHSWPEDPWTAPPTSRPRRRN